MTETPKAPKRAPRRWTQARQRTFLETLAQTSNVAASERKAKMPAGSAYRERRRSAEFEAAWREAHLLLHGDAYLQILTDADGVPAMLYARGRNG